MDRTRGSHVFLRHPDGRTTTVPIHSGETIGPGLLRAILAMLSCLSTNLRTFFSVRTCIQGNPAPPRSRSGVA